MRTERSSLKMRIEKLTVKNFRVLQDVTLSSVPSLAVFIGKNGVGKSTLFQVFGFLKDALMNNVTTALKKRGGYEEVVTRGHEGEPIVVEIRFRMDITGKNRLVTYFLEINQSDRFRPIIKREYLCYKRGEHGKPYHFLDFHAGKGTAITNEEDFSKPDKELEREKHELESPDILAIKGLGQFQRFKAAAAFRWLIENWHVSNFHIDHARQKSEAGVAEHLSETGDNLPLVTQYLYEHKKEIFHEILRKFRENIPGMEGVTPAQSPDGYVLLRFQDGTYKDPFIARYVSDGTIKMFAYLVLLNDPAPHPFLCVEEPENQLYPELMQFLVEELREYGRRGGQVFVSTHSPDFLDHVHGEEAFMMKKQEGKTSISRLTTDPAIKNIADSGNMLGYLWQKGFLEHLA